MPATRAHYSLIVTIDQAGEAREFVTSAASDGVRAPPPAASVFPPSVLPREGGVRPPAPSPAGLSRKAGAKPVSTSATAWFSGLSLRHVTRRGPSWRFADRVHIGYASSRALHPETGFPDPVSIDRLPLPFLRPAHAPDSYPPGHLSGDGESPVTLLLGHQRPDDARHPVGQRHGDQHPRLARQHPGDPRKWALSRRSSKGYVNWDRMNALLRQFPLPQATLPPVVRTSAEANLPCEEPSAWVRARSGLRGEGLGNAMAFP